MQKHNNNFFFSTIAIIFFYSQFMSVNAAILPVNGNGKNNVLADVNVTNAVVYVPLGSSQTTIAFFTLKNNSTVPVAITKVTSPAVKKIELVPAIPGGDAVNPWLISAHQTLELNPSNQRLQLTGLKNSLSTGDELQLEVSLSNGKTLLLIARAKSAFDQIHGH